MAPLITVIPPNAPRKAVDGMTKSIATSSSAIPIPIRPQGSIPNSEKIYTLSGAAENLKNSVCKKITAVPSLSIQEMIVLKFIFNKT